MKKIVLTGAAGCLGGLLRKPLSNVCDELLSTDIVDDIGALGNNETYVKADLGELDQIEPLLKDADQVVHFGAICDEAAWDKILHSNIIGAYNIWEAAYRNGVKRVVYASSIHAVGMVPKNITINANTPHRPDTYYGLAKCFAEDLASLYWDKRGIEAVCLRIYSAAPVKNARSLGSWLSDDDFVQLVERAVDTPVTGLAIVYGISDNDRSPVDNTGAKFIGFRPKDNAEIYAAEVLANSPPVDPRDPAHMCHGGPFASVELGNSGVAGIKQMNRT